MSARAIVLAAGKGTRMRSARHKVLFDLCGRPMLWWVLEALRAAAIDDVVVVTNPELDADVAALGVRTVVQAEQLGTGHAVRVALDALAPSPGVVVVAYGDMPLVEPRVFEDVLAIVDGIAGTVLALATARMPLPSNFGRIVRSESGGVERIVEARDCTPDELGRDEMNAGIYAFYEPALRDAIVRIGAENAQREYYLTDTIALLVGGGHRVAPVSVGDYRTVLGVNDRVELANARRQINRRLCEQHMRAGVTIVDPAATWLDAGLQIGADTVILPGTTLSGTTTIGARCRLGPHSRIEASTVADDVEIAESVVVASSIGSRCTIGPFAHLRQGAFLAGGVHVGNFVEIKASTLAQGVKAGHLTYLGDATIGARTNVGAGTITCNFDGVRKNRTVIGEDAFIGSNSSLVAPIDVGDGAATGAGTVAIRDIEPGDKVAGNPGRSIVKRPAET
ncbi:MAG: bifunctional UDP-N-acetylglucosamine diphosphorylase/glucosamine-1-phosphate N-acetyltransferase GlmU [Candidatus Eremiobacteraeota bacterium]|nr:bifunctional UDP-N-acetylglucosamine diphosphorylase/glucosamine-1-phosphate N-acetyltransferase GlmU [Candidatus Eremiobacteraeota bacterium]